MKRLQDELKEIADPIADNIMSNRIKNLKYQAKYAFDEIKERALEAAKKGDKSTHYTVRPNEKLSFPFYFLEELLKEHFDRYSIEDFGNNGCASIIYVYWS